MSKVTWALVESFIACSTRVLRRASSHSAVRESMKDSVALIVVSPLMVNLSDTEVLDLVPTHESKLKSLDLHLSIVLLGALGLGFRNIWIFLHKDY